jgi:hypothetical protein
MWERNVILDEMHNQDNDSVFHHSKQTLDSQVFTEAYLFKLGQLGNIYFSFLYNYCSKYFSVPNM